MNAIQLKEDSLMDKTVNVANTCIDGVMSGAARLYRVPNNLSNEKHFEECVEVLTKVVVMPLYSLPFSKFQINSKDESKLNKAKKGFIYAGNIGLEVLLKATILAGAYMFKEGYW